MIRIHISNLDQLTDTLRERFSRWLDSDERQRFDRITVFEAKDRFLLGRALIRSVLARQLEIDQAAVVLAKNQFGRPYCPIPTMQGDFNISHSGRHVVMAWCNDGRIGIDIETISRKRNFLALTRRYFHPAEVAALEKSADDVLAMHFYQHWTLKEACIKSTDAVLNETMLRQCAFAFSADKGIDILSLPERSPGMQTLVWQYKLNTDLMCALAWRGHGAVKILPIEIQTGIPGAAWQSISLPCIRSE